MTSTQSLPHPLAVRELRIHLAENHTIAHQELTAVAGRDLATCMSLNGILEPDLDEKLGDYWNCRVWAKWMTAHPQAV